VATNNLKQIYVFIASPGDVGSARSSVRDAIGRINRLVAKDNGFLLEPIGWEDIPPGKGRRAQEVINPYVDAASIFVGILHRRFGEPTGEAESGTEEEYNRIERRWENEDPKPEVLMYFKTIPHEETTNPGENLRKVLAFKQRIGATCFYKEFESERELLELVQDALHDWVLKNRDRFEQAGAANEIVTQEPHDREVLACIVAEGSASTLIISSRLHQGIATVEASVRRLQKLGLIADAQGVVRPINSTSGFLAVARHLNTDAHYKTLLASSYLQNMLSSSLRAHILSRFHCELPLEIAEYLQSIARLSPSAMAYLLFGDTSIHDNLRESITDASKAAREYASELMQSRLILCTLLEYGSDYTKGRVMTELAAKRLAGQLLTVSLKVAYEEAKAFEIGVGVPFVCARAGCDLKAGQMCYGSPEFAIRTGTIYMHLDLDGLAQGQFDQALSQELSADDRATALNNKGLLSLKHNLLADAISLFEEANKVAPNRTEPKRNLEFAKTKLSEGRNG
jgi:tetratricopeptide (TPR) repeat protein